MDKNAQRICRYAKQCVSRGLMASMSGNLSTRVAPGVVMMTPTGCMKDELSEEDLVCVDLQGHRIAGHTAISTEGWMHLAMYRARASIGAIVHAHPVAITALALVEETPSLDVTSEGVDFVGPIATVPWYVPGSIALAHAVGAAASHSDAIVLRNHGAVTAGASLQEAFARMQSLEQVAQIYMMIR